MKKLLVLMLAVGMVCLAGAAFAQNNANPDSVDNGAANQTTQDVGVQVTNPNLLGATQGSGDGNANVDGDDAVQVNVPDANIAGATADGDNGIAVDADAAAQDGSLAQDGDTNVAVTDPELALAGKQAATDGATNNDASASALLGKQVGSNSTQTDDSANALLAKQNAGGSATNTDDSANALLAKQQGTTGATNTDDSANALLAKQQGTTGATNTDDSANALGTANSGDGGNAQTAGAANNGNNDVAQFGETNVSVPDATVQALGKNMADDGGTITDDSAYALGSAATTGSNAQTAGAAANGGSEAISQAHATAAVPVFVSTPGNLDEDGEGQLEAEARQLPDGLGGQANFNQADNAATGGSTAMGGVDNENTLITNPEVALAGKMAATGTGTNTDNSVNNFGASQATNGSSSVGFQTPITNVYPGMLYDQDPKAAASDGAVIGTPVGGGGTTQVGAAGGSMAFGGLNDTGLIGDGSIAQGGSENVNANNLTSSPIQYRETNGSEGVAMDDARAQNVEDYGSAAQDTGLAQGGRDNVNVIVTDPALQFGDANAYANNGSTALAVGDDSALATDTGKAQTGYANAMDNGIAQDGQNNLNNVGGPVQVRNIEDNFGAISQDGGQAQKGFVNTAAQNDGQAQTGLLNTQAKDQANAQTGLNNMNNVTSSPVQIRGTYNDDGAVAMDSGVAFGENKGGQQANNGNNQSIGDYASGVQGNDSAKGMNFTQLVNPGSSNSKKDGPPREAESLNGGMGGYAVDPSVVQANVGAIDSDHVQGGMDNQNAMDNGMNLQDVHDSAVSYNGNAMTQDVDEEGIGNQVVAGDGSPVQVRALGEVENSALAMDTGKAQSIADESIGTQAMDNGVSQLGLTNANSGVAQSGLTNANTGTAQTGVTNANSGQAQTGLLNTQANSGNAQTGLTNANSGQAQTGLLNTQANSGNAQTGLTNANSGQAQTGLANTTGAGMANGQVVVDGVGIQAGDTSPIQYRETEAKDYSVVTMDSGVSLGGKENFNTYAGDNSPVQARYNDVDDGSAVAQDTGIAISKPDDSPIAINGSKAIGSVNDESAVGMDNARVVSDPSDAAIAQGDGGVALNDTEHFAVSTGNYSPAIQDADNVAFVGAGGYSIQDVEKANVNQGSGQAAKQLGLANAANNGSGQAVNQAGLLNANNQGSGIGANNALGAINQGGGNAQAVNAFSAPANANQGSGIANQGQMGVANITDNGDITVSPQLGATPAGPPPTTVQGIQTIAVTQLKQVNAGVSIGNNNYSYSGGAQVNANSSGSSTTGVYSSSGSIGTASNSASMNVVNVSANITQRTGQ